MIARRLAGALLGAGLLAGCAAPAPTPGARPDRKRQAVLHVDAFSPAGSLVRCWTFGEDVPWDAASISVNRVGWIMTAFSTRPKLPQGRPSTLVMATDADSGVMWSATVDGDPGCAEAVTAFAFDHKGSTWVVSKEIPGFPGAAGPTWIFRRFGPRGRLEWSRSACFGTCAGIVTSLQPVGKRDFVIAGIEEKVSVVARFAEAGYPVWSWVDEGAHLVSLATDGSASIYVCGVRPMERGEEWEVVKLGADGSMLWSRTYSGRAHLLHPSRANSIAVDADGNVIVGGSDTGPSLPPGEDWLLRRYSPGGDLLWERSWNAVDNRVDLSADVIHAVAADPAGNLYALGDTRVNTTEPVPLLRKFSPAGQVLWTRTAPGTAALALTIDGRIITAGITRF